MGLSQNGVPHSNQWLNSNITHEHSFFGGILHFQTRRHITHVVGILYPIISPFMDVCFPHFPTNSTCSSMKLRLLMVIIVTVVHHVRIVNPNWNTSKPGNFIGWLTTILITNATVSGQVFYLNTGLPQAKDAAAAKATEYDDAKSRREQMELVRYPSRVMPRDSLKMFKHMGYLPIAIF